VSATQDAYLATTMSGASKDVLTQMSKGTAGGPTSVTTTTTLYFKPGTEETPSGTLPTAHLPTGETFTGGTFVARAMTPTNPTVAYETRETTAASVTTGTTQTWRRVSFISPPVATGFTTTANNWTVNVFDRESSANANARARYSIYTINAAGALAQTIVARVNFGTEMATTALPGGQQALSATATSGRSVAVGDRIVVDLEVQTLTVTAAGNYSFGYSFGSGAAANLTMTTPVAFTYASTSVASGRHDVAGYSGRHKTVETRGDIAANKHVECADCHNPHAATAGAGGASGTASAAGTTTTLTDTTKAWTANQWAGYYVSFRTGTGNVQEAQIVSNTATVLTFQAVTTLPASGTAYRIKTREIGGFPTAVAATTLTDTLKNWPASALVGWSVRIVRGTGVGQVRTISANTATMLTVSAAWTTTPATTSVYEVVKTANGPLAGTPGVDVTTFNATTWGGVTTYNPSTTTAALVATNTTWQVCAKCHSGANANLLTTWSSGMPANGTFTDIAQEFSPSNGSYHPIVQALPATDPGTSGSSRLEAVTLVNGWRPGDLMTCTDCHNTDAASPAAQGPHGSAIKYMLAGVNQAWPFTSAASNGAATGTMFRVNTSETNIGTRDGLFCRNCHAAMNGGSTVTNSLHTFANTASHTGTYAIPACVSCHIRIPHGGKMSRLLRSPNAPDRYEVMSVWPAMIGFTKGARNSYSSSGGWDSNCNDHGDTTSTEAW
jgi:hypothetical protein